MSDVCRTIEMSAVCMTFEEACEKDRYELVDTFGIEVADNICHECVHLYECPARVQFHEEYPSDSIKGCKFYKEY